MICNREELFVSMLSEIEEQILVEELMMGRDPNHHGPRLALLQANQELLSSILDTEETRLCVVLNGETI
jgi:hypothetical protein